MGRDIAGATGIPVFKPRSSDVRILFVDLIALIPSYHVSLSGRNVLSKRSFEMIFEVCMQGRDQTLRRQCRSLERGVH